MNMNTCKCLLRRCCVPVREKRQELPKLIERALGEKPGREELDAFLTFFDITATGIMDSMEFGNGQGRGDVQSTSHTTCKSHIPRVEAALNRLRQASHRHCLAVYLS